MSKSGQKKAKHEFRHLLVADSVQLQSSLLQFQPLFFSSSFSNVGRLHASSAINTKDLAVDPFTILTGQESGDARNINWHTHSVHGRPCSRILINLLIVQVLAVGDVLLAHGVVHVSLDTTGGDGVDGDFLVAAVDGHAAHESLDGTLAAGVDGVFGHALGLACDGAHEDDAAADFKVLVCFSCDEELAASVDAEDSVEFFFSDILEVAEGDDAGVGDDNVEFAEVLLGFGEHVDGFGDVGDVGLHCDGVSAEGFDFFDELIGGRGGVGVVDDDVGATAGEFKSSFSAHASS